MKIALFTDTYPPEINGVASSIFNLRRILEQNGHKVLIITVNHKKEIYSYDTNKRIIYISKNQLNYYNKYPMLSSSLIESLRLIIDDFKPDVIHAQTGWGICSIALKMSILCDIPLVFTYLNMDNEYINYATEDNIKGIRKILIKKNISNIITKSNELITTTNNTKDFVRSLGIDKYISVIPNCIDFNNFKEIDINTINKKKQELGIFETSKVFLVISKLDNQKNVDMVIDGYSRFKRAHPEIDSTLLIVGNGPALKSLINLSEELHVKDSVKFIGSVRSSETNLYYHMSDIYLSASINESQRLTYFEAIASKLICLVRFDNDLLDIIKDEETGFYFHNGTDCAQIMYRIINMKEKNLDNIKNNAIDSIKEYSIDKYYQNIIHVYERAIKKNW